MSLEDRIIKYIEKLPYYLKVIIIVLMLVSLFIFFSDMHD